MHPPAPVSDLNHAAFVLGVPDGAITPQVIARFWGNVEMRADPDACWWWGGNRQGNGYGQIMVRGRTLLAHRFVVAVHHGTLTLDAPLALHSCDNPSCVNPRHLAAGTHAENNRQARARGRRMRYADGEVRAMRDAYDYLITEGFLASTAQREVARRFDANPSSILPLITGRSPRGRRLGLHLRPVPTPRPWRSIPVAVEDE